MPDPRILLALLALGLPLAAQDAARAIASKSPAPTSTEAKDEAPLRLRYQGRLMTLDEIAHAKMLEDRERRNRALYRKVRPHFERLTSRSKRVRDRALGRLVAIARAKDRPRIANEARRLHARSAVHWTVAVVEVRAQHAGPTTLRRRSIGLGGTSSPVSLELPSRPFTSIGTTVGVPVGF